MPISALIVEDDNDFRMILELRLKNWKSDIRISHAGNIAKARETIDKATESFSLVILDQQLPDGMGWTLLDHPKLAESAVLAVSSDNSPELPGQTMLAGASHFLAKRQVTEPLFVPLLEAIIERKQLAKEILKLRIKESKIETIKVLLATLRHEINNPLGAVLGGAYLLRSRGLADEAQNEALKIIEGSGTRIKHVIDQLCDTAELESVKKGNEQVFQVPGDESWEKKL